MGRLVPLVLQERQDPQGNLTARCKHLDLCSGHSTLDAKVLAAGAGGMGLSNWLQVRIMWEPQNHQIRATPQTNCIRPLGWGGVGPGFLFVVLQYYIQNKRYHLNLFQHNVL